MKATSTAVRREITVAAPPERTFEVCVEGSDTWWPREYSIGSAEPPSRILLAWAIAGDWAPDEGGWGGLPARYSDALG